MAAAVNNQNIDSKRKGAEYAEHTQSQKKQRAYPCGKEGIDLKRKCIDEQISVKKQRVDGVQEKGHVGSSSVQVAAVKDGLVADGTTVSSYVQDSFSSRACAINYSTFGQTLAASSRQDFGNTEKKIRNINPF